MRNEKKNLKHYWTCDRHTNNQPWSEYKHSLTFRVRRAAIRICSVYVYKLTYVYVVIATKPVPVHRLQIRPILHNCGTPYYSPKLHLGPCSSVWMRRGTDSHTDTQTAVANIHFASAIPHAKCNDWVTAIAMQWTFSYLKLHVVKVYIITYSTDAQILTRGNCSVLSLMECRISTRSRGSVRLKTVRIHCTDAEQNCRKRNKCCRATGRWSEIQF